MKLQFVLFFVRLAMQNCSLPPLGVKLFGNFCCGNWKMGAYLVLDGLGSNGPRLTTPGVDGKGLGAGLG
jgi:hypothetical protein